MKPYQCALGAFWRDCSGSAAIEFVAGFLVLLTVLFGIMSYGEIFFTQIQLGNVAGSAARELVVARNADDRAEIFSSSRERWLQPFIFPDCATIDLVQREGTLEVVTEYDFTVEDTTCRIVPKMPLIPVPDKLSAQVTVTPED